MEIGVSTGMAQITVIPGAEKAESHKGGGTLGLSL
jgi:hypothetical protein